jgi:hypothetical protein
MWILKDDYLWIRNNPETFRKCLHSYFDFIGKNLTHWRIEVVLPKDHLVMVTLYKDSIKKDWFSINGSTGGSSRYVTANLYPNESSYKSYTSIYYKQLDPIWNECFENDTIWKSLLDARQNFLTTMFKVLERDRKLKELLN